MFIEKLKNQKNFIRLIIWYCFFAPILIIVSTIIMAIAFIPVWKIRKASAKLMFEQYLEFMSDIWYIMRDIDEEE